MLSERIQEEVDRRAARLQAANARRAVADGIIQPAFEQLHADLVQMVRNVVGVHGLLTVTTTPTAIPVTTRTFNVLNIERVEVVSTLNAAPETLRFVPSLSFVTKEEFGRVAVETEGIPDVSLQHRPELLAIQREGILMKGYAAPRLVTLQDGTTRDLTARSLEDFLAAVLIRGGEL